MAEKALQVIIPGWVTKIGDELLICTNGYSHLPPGVLIIPSDKSYIRFISNSWYD